MSTLSSQFTVTSISSYIQSPKFTHNHAIITFSSRPISSISTRTVRCRLSVAPKKGISRGGVKSLTDVTSSNYLVVKDYNRLVKSLEPPIRRLSDDQALLSGCSAGGLAVFLHCDNFTSYLPNNASVKCLSDAGFFFDARDIMLNHTIRNFYEDLISLQFGCSGLRKEMLAALYMFYKYSRRGGMFINSCFAHCQSESQDTWYAADSPRVHNKTIADAVGDWYFGRRITKEIDCAYPCGSICHNIIG